MAGAKDHHCAVLAVGADLFHFVEGTAGRYKSKRAPFKLLIFFPAQSQPEAVHRNNGQHAVANFKKRTGVHNAAFVRGHGKGCTANHGFENVLPDCAGIIVFHIRKIRKVRGIQAEDMKIRVAAGHGNHQLVVAGENDHIVGHFADNVAEQAGV